ncbi:MAG TPA: ribonuclease E inhibitor RraB [Candidatus Angelobacter sp.]|nr:ribonuclease E inhibitor RraB [Candidatus Angelobacter sp.]
MEMRLAAVLVILLCVSPLFGLYSTPDPDQLLIEQLAKSGGDLSKPHNIVFLLYFPSAEGAAKAAGDVYEKKFDVNVLKPTKAGEPWSCAARKTMVPDLKALQKIRRQFMAIATANGGEYRGWSTESMK